MSNDRVNRENWNLYLKIGKLSAKGLYKLSVYILKRMKDEAEHLPKGEQTVKDLIRSGQKIGEPIELSRNQDFQLFHECMKEFGVDYAVRENYGQYYLFFKTRDVEVIQYAFEFYTQKYLDQRKDIHQDLQKIKTGIAKDVEKSNYKEKERKKTKEQPSH